MALQPTICTVEQLESLCEQVSKSANDKFADLIKKLNIDSDKNKSDATKYNALLKEIKKLRRSVKACKVFKWILIIFLVFPYFLLNNAQKKKQALLDEKDKELTKVKAELDKQLSAIHPLINNEFAYREIIEPIWKDIKFNSFLSSQESINWNGHLETILGKNAHATKLVSGQLFEHPFIIFNKKEQLWGTHTYTGSVPVTYTARDSNGNMVTRTTVVTASETLPEPYWTVDTKLAYRTDVATELTFTNEVSKHEAKKAGKKTQSPMDNPQFDKLFPSIRNDEQKFRTVFSVLAQEGFVKLLKERFFQLNKNGDVTVVSLPDNHDILLENNIDSEFDYDVSKWQESFAAAVRKFVYTVGTYSLPICNIPLYQNIKYKWPHGSAKLSILQSMSNAELCCASYPNVKSLFETDVIFHPIGSTTSKVNGITLTQTNIKCDYFHPHHETIYKTAMGPDGAVTVPIHIIRYFPKSKTLSLIESYDWKDIKNIDVATNSYLIQNGQFICIAQKNNVNDIVNQAIKFANQNKKKD